MRDNVTKDQCIHKILYGRDMKTERETLYETVWTLPKGVVVKDDTRYEIWYTWHDSADPSDSSTYYRVYFIKEL